MKKYFSWLAVFTLPLCLAVLVLPLSVVPSASAAFSPAIVGADAQWVVYADLNSLRDSTLGKQLIETAQKAQFQVANGTVGVDVPKVLATVGTITAYGTNMSTDPKKLDGTLVVQGTPDLRKIVESLLLQATIGSPKDVSEVTDLPFPAYAITSHSNAANSAPAMEVVIAFPPEPIVLVSKSRAQILKARDVFRGSADSLAKARSSQLTKLLGGAPNALLFAASVVPSEKIFPDNGPQARILQMANASAIALGERGPDIFAHVDLSASSSAMAEKLMKILEGLTAMLSLAETTDKQLMEFLNSTTVARNGDMVTLDLSYSSARLAQMVQNLQQAQKPPEPRPARASMMISGKALAEWHAEAATDAPDKITTATRTIENVALKNGTTITFGRQSNGGKNIGFDRVEITPADGTDAPLVFRSEFMKVFGSRGNMAQFQFPGADGTYTLKVTYRNDPDGKATYAVSLKDPNPSSDAK